MEPNDSSSFFHRNRAQRSLSAGTLVRFLDRVEQAAKPRDANDFANRIADMFQHELRSRNRRQCGTAGSSINSR